jgi:hypothetical protein
MELTRRQLGLIFGGIYGAAGILLLRDYLADPSAAGAHLALAWHVFPVSLAASLLSVVADTSGPLDPQWHVPVHTIVVSYGAALAACTGGIVRLVSGGSEAVGQPAGNYDD